MSLEPITTANDANVKSAQTELVRANLRVLFQLREALSSLCDERYARQPDASTSSIGMHARHIIEFYQEFLKAVESPESQDLCYDRRQRNMVLETSRSDALAAISELEKTFMETGFADSQLHMCCVIDPDAPLCNMQSTVHRELFHILDHCIHHMALIKMVGRQLGAEFDKDFGLANATKQYQNNA